MTAKVREVLAHLPSPGRPGSLCGEVSRLVRCEACDRRRESMLQVHIQSPRKPGKAFCGLLLRSEKILPVGSRGADPPPMYVSHQRARDIVADPAGSSLPICPGCVVNMGRFDEASARRSCRESDEDRAEAAITRARSSVEDGRRRVEVTRSGAHPAGAHPAAADLPDDGEDHDD